MKLRKKNIKERKELLKGISKDKEAVNAAFCPPKAKKQKTKNKPKVTSEYGLRTNPKRNQKYTE